MNDDESNRLQERAKRIHGENPFSAELMALDAFLEDERKRSGKVQRRVKDDDYLDERMHHG